MGGHRVNETPEDVLTREWITMRTIGKLLFVVSVLAGIWCASRRAEGEPDNALDPATQTSLGPSAKTFRYLGVGSCAAQACHGGIGEADKPGCEYTTWVSRDPHAGAHALLLGDDARRIGKNLRIPHPENAAACLACHGTQVPPTQRGPHLLAEDGVSCEICHGPASDWVNEHYSANWANLSTSQKAERGFANLRNLPLRIARCSLCHVGAGDRDVNHDLIAAGHPRLNFEFSAYEASLPKHWRDAKPTAREPEFSSKSWALGQVVTSKAALELLVHRVDSPLWPEFTEYGCFACHHDLKQGNWRQQRGFAGRPGELSWGSWYFALLPSVDADEFPKIQPDLDRLRVLMRSPFPERARVRESARKVIGLLDNWTEQLHNRRFTAADTLALMQRVARAPQIDEWDHAAQRYLALSALTRARRFANSGTNGVADPALPLLNAIEVFGDKLEFPQEERPADAATQRLTQRLMPGLDQPPRYQSPRGFRPKDIEEVLHGIREKLPLWEK